MYNKFIDRLLDSDPKKVLSKGSIRARKIISPVLRFAIPFVTPNSKLRVLRRARLPKQPVLFAPTHGFREDVEHTVVMAKRQAYVLNGSLTQLYRSIDGITSWLAGVIPIDRTKKESRASAKKKIVYALELGASVIMYPEGTWNKSPNQLMSGFFPGIYDVAKESGALVVPIATYRNGKKAYGIMEEAFDICAYDRETGLRVLRDKLATMQYEMMEQYGQAKRTDFPYGAEADAYWKQYVDDLMAQVKYYDYDVELHTKYVDKTVTSPEEVFAFMKMLEVKKENAFLLRR
ncbi:MAG: 1-acyl-sn-glycerol-3-phosphate acyltransferase [Lachnospiraceae bacterium]|nr:1-acyl-sn-glycerol-3-phosphate acyltransferase [Lachnospiraceae bacterium]